MSSRALTLYTKQFDTSQFICNIYESELSKAKKEANSELTRVRQIIEEFGAITANLIMNHNSVALNEELSKKISSLRGEIIEVGYRRVIPLKGSKVTLFKKELEGTLNSIDHLTSWTQSLVHTIIRIQEELAPRINTISSKSSSSASKEEANPVLIRVSQINEELSLIVSDFVMNHHSKVLNEMLSKKISSLRNEINEIAYRQVILLKKSEGSIGNLSSWIQPLIHTIIGMQDELAPRIKTPAAFGEHSLPESKG